MGFNKAVRLILAGLLIFHAVSTVGVAFAHADLASSEPAPSSVLSRPPEKVLIRFTEPVEPKFSEIQVLDERGQRVDKGDSSVDSSDPSILSVTLSSLSFGIYTVVWKNISALDGHGENGTYVFSVGVPLTTPASALPEVSAREQLRSPLEPWLKWILLATLLALFGSLTFRLLVSQPVLAGRDSKAQVQQLSRKLASSTLKFLWILAIGFLLASLVQLVVQTSYAYGISSGKAINFLLMLSILNTGWGKLWSWRIFLFLIMLNTYDFTLSRQSKADKDDMAGFLPGAFQWVSLLTGMGVLLTLSLGSHAAATSGVSTPAALSDYLHLLASGIWVGGLFYFVFSIPRFMSMPEIRDRGATMAAIVRRYSLMAVLCVAVLVLTGLYGAWSQVTVLRALRTGYGVTLLVKVGIFLLLLLPAALNLLWVKPRLAERAKAQKWLRRLVSAEVLMAIALLFTVGLLTSLEPARQAVSRLEVQKKSGEILLSRTVDGNKINMQVTPGKLGANLFIIILLDRNGQPVRNAEAVTLKLVNLEAKVELPVESTLNHGEGTWVAHEGFLSTAGQWQAEVVVRRPDAFDARVDFQFDIGAETAAGNAPVAPSRRTGYFLGGAELVLLGAFFMFYARSAWSWWRNVGIFLIGAGGLALLAGFILIVAKVLF